MYQDLQLLAAARLLSIGDERVVRTLLYNPLSAEFDPRAVMQRSHIDRCIGVSGRPCTG